MVTAAGQEGQISPGVGADGGFPSGKGYPAKLGGSEDIIVAGSVVATSGPNNGVRNSWSAGGSQVTVYPPGNRACADTLVTGDVIATTTQAEGEGASRVPRAMKNYLMSMCFRRYVNLSDPAWVEESV